MVAYAAMFIRNLKQALVGVLNARFSSSWAFLVLWTVLQCLKRYGGRCPELL